VFVVVVLDPAAVLSVSGELTALGAGGLDRRPSRGGRQLLFARFDDPTAAEGAAASLRRAGVSAVVRPVGGGHLSAWLANTRPVVISDRLTVCFPWSEFGGDEPNNIVEIDPGRAFGTGAHPSTRLLLGELARRLGGRERVLDVGCGSGVLAISAARLGADVTAVDITAEALAATRRNAIHNGVDAHVEVSATPVERLPGCFDVIVANIGAAVLIESASALQSHLAPTGWLALSGLSPGQISKVAAAYGRIEITSAPSDDDWVALVGRPRPSVAGSEGTVPESALRFG